MPMGERGWNDKRENYADGYLLLVNGSTATAVGARDFKQPAIVYSITVSVGSQLVTGDVSLVDGSATGDAGDTRRFRCRVASGAAFGPIPPGHFFFPRGIAFDTGLIVSATTITGDITLTYKARYP